MQEGAETTSPAPSHLTPQRAAAPRALPSPEGAASPHRRPLESPPGPRRPLRAAQQAHRQPAQRAGPRAGCTSPHGPGGDDCRSAGAGPTRTYLAGGAPRGPQPRQVAGTRSQSFPAQRSAAESSSSCCAAAQLRHPEPPGAFTSCRELREPRGVGGQVAGSARAQSPSLTDCREDSAARRPRKLRVPPSGRARRARSPSRAGGDGPSATAISARGEGAPAALSPAPPPPPLSAPSAPGLMDEPRAALANPSLRAQEAASRKQTGRA